jgi:hypothetical protein
MKNKQIIKKLILAFVLTAGGVAQGLALGLDENLNPYDDPMPETNSVNVEASSPYTINTIEDLLIMVNNHLYTYQSKDSITSDQLPPSN